MQENSLQLNFCSTRLEYVTYEVNDSDDAFSSRDASYSRVANLQSPSLSKSSLSISVKHYLLS